MYFSNKVYLTLICCLFLQGCYADVQTLNLSDIPAVTERKLQDESALKQELKEAAAKNKAREENFNKEK